MAQRSIRIDDIVARARSRADMVESEFWTDDELKNLAEAKFQQFYLAAAGEFDEFFTTRWTYSTVSGTSTVQLTQPNLLKLRGVQHQNDWFIRKIDLLEQPSVVAPLERGKPRYYSLRIDPAIELPFLDLFPTPDAVYALTVHYVPIYGLQQLQQALGESKALYMLAGWDEFLVVKMAIAMKDREESDCSVLIGEAAELTAAMNRQMKPVDMQEPGGVIQWGGMAGGKSIYSDPYELEDHLG